MAEELEGNDILSHTVVVGDCVAAICKKPTRLVIGKVTKVTQKMFWVESTDGQNFLARQKHCVKVDPVEAAQYVLTE